MSEELDLELSEALVKDLASIGLEVVLKGYFSNLKKLAEDVGEEWDDERTDIIGQNGNDGLHYNEDKEGM
jgi:hypothetical protein